MTAPRTPSRKVRLWLGRRGTKLSMLAASAALVLAGCGSVHPGSAAVVGAETITHSEVDELADAFCSASVSTAQAQGQAAPETATRGAREGALQLLLETALSRQFGEHENVDPDPQQVSQALEQNEQGVALVPPGQREGLRSVLREYAEAQLMLVEAGRKSLAADSTTQVPDEQAFAEGERLRTDFVNGLDVEVDPRYGTFSEGAIQRGTSSLSVPASDDARAGARAEPAAAWVSALPASQKCS